MLGGVNPEEEAAGKVQQKGSDVNADRLRFDFSWDESLTKDQLAEVERIANAQIAAAHPVHASVVPLSEAQAIHGLRAVFGEAYPDPVRVVSIGAKVGELVKDPSNPKWAAYSVEFCGGTHLPHLGHAKGLVITEESSTAAGVRRLTAVTRQRAVDAVASGKALLALVAEAEVHLKTPGPELVGAAKNLKKALSTWAAVPQVVKYEAVERCAALEKASLEFGKAVTKKLAAEALVQAEALVSSGALAGSAKVAVRIDYGGGKTVGKTHSAVMKVLSTASKDASVLVVSYDPTEGKVSVFGSVAKSSDSPSALAWCEAALQGLQGAKCGGKEKNANGSADCGSEANAAQVLANAKAFVA